ncbi:MAG: DNA repair protein RecO [Patescibacteria group bacterium]|nr:DNA repair protein RecO [Patescibacteria group bacterium]
MSDKIINGLVLRHFPVREADEFLTLWSFEEGKMRAMARSARKSSSKLKPVLAPVTWLQLEVVPNASRYVVVGVRITRSYPRILQNLRHLAVVFNLFEIVMHATMEGEPNHKVSILLRESLEQLEQESSVGIDFLNDFRLRFLSALGYGFQQAACRYCGGSLFSSAGASWSNTFLGLICGNCGQYDAAAAGVEREVVEYFLKADPASAVRKVSAVPLDLKLKIERMLSEMLSGVIERKINSRQFLAEQVKF